MMFFLTLIHESDSWKHQLIFIISYYSGRFETSCEWLSRFTDEKELERDALLFDEYVIRIKLKIPRANDDRGQRGRTQGASESKDETVREKCSDCIDFHSGPTNCSLVYIRCFSSSFWLLYHKSRIFHFCSWLCLFLYIFAVKSFTSQHTIHLSISNDNLWKRILSLLKILRNNFWSKGIILIYY